MINPRLLPLNALSNYGGSSDLDMVDQYLKCFIVGKQEQDAKIAELFDLAFDFVNKDTNWFAIAVLADYILKNDNRVISYEEVESIAARQESSSPQKR